MQQGYPRHAQENDVSYVQFGHRHEHNQYTYVDTILHGGPETAQEAETHVQSSSVEARVGKPPMERILEMFLSVKFIKVEQTLSCCILKDERMCGKGLKLSTGPRVNYNASKEVPIIEIFVCYYHY